MIQGKPTYQQYVSSMVMIMQQSIFPFYELFVKHVILKCRALASASLDSSARVSTLEDEKKTGKFLS